MYVNKCSKEMNRELVYEEINSINNYTKNHSLF